MSTTIQVSDKIWKELNKRKEKGETFIDVLNKLLNIKNEKKESEKKKDGM